WKKSPANAQDVDALPGLARNRGDGLRVGTLRPKTRSVQGGSRSFSPSLTGTDFARQFVAKHSKLACISRSVVDWRQFAFPHHSLMFLARVLDSILGIAAAHWQEFHNFVPIESCIRRL